MCAAGAVNDTLCIWRVKDGITVTETFPELITALQWKPGQRDSETPLLVVGLLGGDLVMVEIMGARVNMSPSLQLTRLEHFGRGETNPHFTLYIEPPSRFKRPSLTSKF